jgi:hypothetical protein
MGAFNAKSQLPVTRFAAAMGDGDNEDKIRLNRVEDAEWEDSREAAPHVLVERSRPDCCPA